jgi:hypothetical protein
MSEKCTDGPYANLISTERVILQIEPYRVRRNG